MKKLFLSIGLLGILTTGCTEEFKNKFSRGIQNWTGTDGVLDIYSNGNVIYRFIKIEKLTTNIDDGVKRSYRYGYGVFDTNKNLKVDPGEKKIYFEISDYSTSYVFYSNPM